jgi:hypothetical protein
MITKAGQDSYDSLRHFLRDQFRRGVHKGPPNEKDQLLVIRPPKPRPDAVLQLWTDLPDEAITALAQLLYDMRTAQPAQPGAGRRWYWNGTARRWQLLEVPPDQKPGETGSSQPHET